MYDAEIMEIKECYSSYKKHPKKFPNKLQRLKEFADTDDLNNPLPNITLEYSMKRELVLIKMKLDL